MNYIGLLVGLIVGMCLLYGAVSLILWLMDRNEQRRVSALSVDQLEAVLIAHVKATGIEAFNPIYREVIKNMSPAEVREAEEMLARIEKEVNRK